MRKEVEIMRVLRQPPLGRLAVEVNQKRVEHLSEVPEKTIQHLLLAAIGELIDFAGGYQVLVDAGVAPPLVGETGKLTPQPSAPKATPSAAPSLRPQARQTAVSVPSHSSVNIVDELNTILQKRLQEEPRLNGRLLKIVRAAAGDLRIEADGKSYQRPEELTDPVLKELLRQALADWEKS